MDGLTLRRVKYLRRVARRQGLRVLTFAPHTQAALYRDLGPYALQRRDDHELVARQLTLAELWDALAETP
ncbi:hypothetical protein [Mycolicibacterium iranicum]|uniref:hypothetical protein n=1 Tax=Mycolicibacterium iranicum TaxID=912594 RepID=UPI002285BCA7|nr:hypothetical protein [Mycolicibacterium iranicum]